MSVLNFRESSKEKGGEKRQEKEKRREAREPSHHRTTNIAKQTSPSYNVLINCKHLHHQSQAMVFYNNIISSQPIQVARTLGWERQKYPTVHRSLGLDWLQHTGGFVSSLLPSHMLILMEIMLSTTFLTFVHELHVLEMLRDKCYSTIHYHQHTH